MVELMREVGFGIPVMHQGAFHVFVGASRWTDDSYAFAFELLERAPAERVGRRREARHGLRPGGEAGGEVQLRVERGGHAPGPVVLVLLRRLTGGCR